MTGLQQAVADANVFLNETASPFLKKTTDHCSNR